MYTIDEQDSVFTLDVVRPDSGAPLPIVLADDGQLLLAFIVHEADPHWDGTYARVVGPDSAGEPIAIIRFERARCHMFGRPNDETLKGHPLYARGLSYYAVHEVRGSSWVRQLERINSVHPQHRPEAFADARHFIFAFHDTTFECVARGFSVTPMRGSMREALERMTTMLSTRS